MSIDGKLSHCEVPCSDKRSSPGRKLLELLTCHRMPQVMLPKTGSTRGLLQLGD